MLIASKTSSNMKPGLLFAMDLVQGCFGADMPYFHRRTPLPKLSSEALSVRKLGYWGGSEQQADPALKIEGYAK